jgi:transcriptional regulator with XRE-family HTH domain
MKSKQIRRDLGKFLKKLRESKKMTLLEVSAYLSMHRIKCSHANLSRIEGGIQTPKADTIAALAIIYEISSDEILFRGN